jgi:hypothetical protein
MSGVCRSRISSKCLSLLFGAWFAGFAASAGVAQEATSKPASGGPIKLSDGATLDGKTLKLEGVNLTLHEQWETAPMQPSPMGPIAIFKLPRAEGEPEDGSVRITHYPNMKGKDDANIDRWLKAVKQADGSPHTRESAKITTSEFGNVRLTVVDISGTVDNSMAGGTSTSGTRMIAAIVDHPKGPHYVRATGTIKTMEKWQAEVDKFFKSAKVTQ